MRCDVMKISKSNPSVKTCGRLMMYLLIIIVPFQKKNNPSHKMPHIRQCLHISRWFCNHFLKVFVILAHFTTNNLVQHPPNNPPTEEKTTSQFCSPFHSAKE
jgi:hypothetical protein